MHQREEEYEELESYLVEVVMDGISKNPVTIMLPPLPSNFRFMKLGCEEGSWQHFNRYVAPEGYSSLNFPLFFDVISDYAPSTYSATHKKKNVIGRMFPVVSGPEGYFYRVEDKGREEISRNNSGIQSIKLSLNQDGGDIPFETTRVTILDETHNSYLYKGIEKLCSKLILILRVTFY